MALRRRIDVLKLLELLGIEGRRRGPELVATCPNPAHPDRNPSWSIVVDGERAGAHICHSCGLQGGPIALVRACVGLKSIEEAKGWLEENVGYRRSQSVSEAKWKPKHRPEPDLPWPEGACSITARNVDRYPFVREAAEYLRGRGLSGRDMVRHKMVAVPPGVRYGGRVIVPIVVRGRMVDFVARLYRPAADMVPKALSGRRDQGARKELSLWGYDDLLSDYPRVVVVEGVWDALHMIRGGVLNVVACCGSAWSIERTDLLGPWPEIVLMPDGDKAGDKLARAAFESLRYAHLVRRVRLPEKTQPESHSIEMLRQFIEDAERPTLLSRTRIVPTPWRSKYQTNP